MRTLLATFIALVVATSGPGEVRAQDMTLVMDGARYWAENCTRCHNARSPLERTDREWVTIVQHMRARGNLTQTEAVAVSAFLQSSNGGADAPAPPPTPAVSRSDERSEEAPPTASTNDLEAHPRSETVAPDDVRRIEDYLRTR